MNLPLLLGFLLFVGVAAVGAWALWDCARYKRQHTGPWGR